MSKHSCLTNGFKEAFDWDGGWVRTLEEDISTLYGREMELDDECRRLRKLMKKLRRKGVESEDMHICAEGFLGRVLNHHNRLNQYPGNSMEELFWDAEQFWIEADKITKDMRSFRKKMMAEVLWAV